MKNSKNISYVLLALLLVVSCYELNMISGVASSLEMGLKLASVVAIIFLGYLNSKK